MLKAGVERISLARRHAGGSAEGMAGVEEVEFRRGGVVVFFFFVFVSEKIIHLIPSMK